MEIGGKTASDYTTLLDEIEKLEKAGDSVCERRILKVNAGKSNVVVFAKGQVTGCRSTLQDQELIVDHFK